MIFPEDEEFLAHYGKKGMKWGVRKAAVQRNRALNKASKAKDKADWQKKVEKARANVASDKVKYDYKKAKTKYKSDKVAVGSREAKKTLAKAREKKVDTIRTARSYKNGKEVAVGVALAVGYVAVQALANSNA